MVRNERGLALAVALMTAIIFGIAAFGLLALAMGRSSQAITVGGGTRLRARYAAEAGLVQVMQKLYAKAPPAPGSCGPWSIPMDTDNDGTNETTVNVTANPCTAASTKLSAKVTF